MRYFYFPNGETLTVNTDSKGAAVQALAPLGTVMDSSMNSRFQERLVGGWMDVSDEYAEAQIARYKRGAERRQAAEAVRKANDGASYALQSRARLR